MDIKKQPAAWYALRRTMPVWSFEENLQEVLAKLPEYKVDELIIKVDVEEFSHGQIPLDWLRGYQKNLFRVKAELEKIGVVYSLNPWITQGHCDRGRDARKALPGLVTYVGHNGVVSQTCACALSPVWQENTRAAWRIYAETKPHIMWVEDDIRSFNHGPARYGCFCELHLKKFSELVGHPVTREELVAAMIAPGKPHPWRKLYLDMQAQVMIDTVTMLGKTVHEVSPDTCMGLMSSGPDSHCLEGRRWHEFANAMADGRPLYSRPPMGNYSESNLRDLRYCAMSIKQTRFVLPADTIEQSEVENFTFTPFAKTATVSYLQMAISFAFGCQGVTLNFFDHLGTPMERYPGYGRMLSARKDYLNALAECTQTPGQWRGVRLLHRDDSSYSRQLAPGSDYQHLGQDGMSSAMILNGMGIANDYYDSNVTWLEGQTIRAYSDAEIRAILSKGVLLDAAAAATLVEMGYGDLIGVEAIRRTARLYEYGPYSVEEFHHEKFGGYRRCHQSLVFGEAMIPLFSEMELKPGAEVLSNLLDPDAGRHQLSAFAYENRLGGRIYGFAFHFGEISALAFFTGIRAAQLQRAIDWLSRGEPDLLVGNDGGHTLAFRKDCADFTLLGAFNLALDNWTEVKLSLAFDRCPAKVEQLMPSGDWQVAGFDLAYDGRKLTMSASQEVDFRYPLILKIR